MTQQQPQKLLTLKAVLELTKLSRTTVYRLTIGGHLNPVRIGRALRFRDVDIVELMNTGVATSTDGQKDGLKL